MFFVLNLFQSNSSQWINFIDITNLSIFFVNFVTLNLNLTRRNFGHTQVCHVDYLVNVFCLPCRMTSSQEKKRMMLKLMKMDH